MSGRRVLVEHKYGNGTIFVDVYNAASGKKVMAGNGPHGGAPAFDYALWVGDEYLIVPLSFRKDDCFLGIMPSR